MFSRAGLLEGCIVVCRRLQDGTPGATCGPELPFSQVAKRAGVMGGLCQASQCCTWDAEQWKESTAFQHVHDQSHCIFDVEGRCALPSEQFTSSCIIATVAACVLLCPARKQQRACTTVQCTSSF